jgi:hypothetical protein
MPRKAPPDLAATVRELIRPIVEDTLAEIAHVRGCATNELSVGEERAIETALYTAWLKCESMHTVVTSSAITRPATGASPTSVSGTWSTPDEDRTPVVHVDPPPQAKRRR